MYLVIGATGNVGSEVATQLLASGKQVRVFTRDATKVSHLKGRAEVAVGDLMQTDTFAKAVAGVEGVFLMNGALEGDAFRQLNRWNRGIWRSTDRVSLDPICGIC
jgi:uncharacterized protein YbjT (DUF2867 family)